MKKLTIALIAGLLTAPAFAQDADPAPASDTVKAVTTNGVIMEVGGNEFDIMYAEDGTFIGGGGMFEGTWKADGDKLCITIPGMVENQCQAYPDGKAAGDSFDLESDMGPMRITIRTPE